MWGDLHESKIIEIALPATITAGEANRLFHELGATLFYDVYSFEAEKTEVWQSCSLVSIDLLKNGVEVDAHNDFNQINAVYLFATSPSYQQKKALKLISKIILIFEGTAKYQGAPYAEKSVQEDWDDCNDFLLKEWGEQPGSESLLRMVEENYA